MPRSIATKARLSPVKVRNYMEVTLANFGLEQGSRAKGGGKRQKREKIGTKIMFTHLYALRRNRKRRKIRRCDVSCRKKASWEGAGLAERKVGPILFNLLTQTDLSLAK